MNAGGVAGSQPMSSEYSCAHGAQINLGDLYLIFKLWYDRSGLSEAHGEPRLRLQDQHGADEAGLHTAGPVQADRTGTSQERIRETKIQDL